MAGKRHSQDSSDNGFIYIVGAIGVGMAKIGYAQDPRSRFAVLQNGSPIRLQPLYLKRGTTADERALLDRFRPLREHGSWHRFDEDNELSAFVVENLDVWMTLDIEDCWGMEYTA